ncbi:hypothetical protein ACUOA5_50565 [Escherichia coli]
MRFSLSIASDFDSKEKRSRPSKNTGFISFDGKTFVYYLYPVTHNRSLIFLPPQKQYQ